MTDTKKLKAAMILKGITSGELADRIGISRQSFSYKMNNLREFRAKEISAISQVLELTLNEKEEIFFTDTVDD